MNIRELVTVGFTARSWREAAWLLLGLPLGVLWFTLVVTLFAVGGALAVVWVGIPLLILTMATLRWVGALERGLVNLLLGGEVAAPKSDGTGRDGVGADRQQSPPSRAAFVGWGRRQFARLYDEHAWRVFAWLAIRVVSGPVGFAIALTAIVVPLSLLSSSVFVAAASAGWIGLDAGDTPLTGQQWWWVAAACLGGFLVTMPALWWLVRLLAWSHTQLARWALGPSSDELVAAATARAAAAEEQVRIDQELHDSIGHMITMNIIQAGAGAHVFDTDPEFARQALKNIEERGRAAMGELDRIIAALRGDQPESRRPLPTLDDIPRLIDESCDAGMVVDAEVESLPVPAAVGRAAFTVVREALTNAARHAPGATVTVRVGPDDDALAIEVVNGKATSASVGGHTGTGSGLASLRDRVALLGGRADTGPEAGGFAVRVLLPREAMLSGSAGNQDGAWGELRATMTS